MALNKDCIRYSGKKKDCPVSQKGKTFRIINSNDSEIILYEVDPCLIPALEQKKCDNLFLINKQKEKLAYFVELKGVDLTAAIQQIDNSINILRKEVAEYKIFGRIVGRRATPDIKSRRAKLDEKLRQLGGDLDIGTRYEYVQNV